MEDIRRNGTPAGTSDVKTLVVDDQRSFRQVMGQLIGATPGFSLVGEARSGEDALAAVEELHPDFVLMDVRMPGIGGVQAARTLARRHPQITVILVSVHGPEELPEELVAEVAPFARKKDLRPRMVRELWDKHQRQVDG